MHELLSIAGAVISLLVGGVFALVQLQWRSTMHGVEKELDYHRTRIDAISENLKAHSVELSRYAATYSSVTQRLESIEEDLGVFRRELVSISQALVRIETLMRKSTPPPKGG